MRRTEPLHLTSYSNSRDFESKNRMGFWIVAVVLCLLPFERLMFPLGIRVVDFAVIVLIIYGLFRFLIQTKRIHLPLLFSVWLILLASIIATLSGFGYRESIIAILQEVYLYIWFIVLTNILSGFSLVELNKLMQFWSVIALVEASATVMGMVGVGPQIFHMSPVDGQILSIEGFNRGFGTYVNPNAAAAYLAISLFVLLATRWPIWLKSIFAMWLLTGIYATGSHGGLLSTLLGVMMLMVVYLRLKLQRKYAFWGIVFGFGAVATLIALLITNLSPSPSSAGSIGGNVFFAFITERLHGSMASRIAFVENAWATFLSHPLGTGPNTSTLYIGTLHNDYIAFLYERGPLGLIGLLWLIGAMLLQAQRTAYRENDGFQSWWMLALGMGFLACAINAFTHEVTHFRQVWVLMAFIFATSYTLSDKSTNVHDVGTIDAEKSRRDLRSFATW